jgi:hypothetical protein
MNVGGWHGERYPEFARLQETTVPPPEPILVPCEGAGAAGHLLVPGARMCPTCGQVHATDADTIPDHVRQDIIAMIARGDFG